MDILRGCSLIREDGLLGDRRSRPTMIPKLISVVCMAYFAWRTWLSRQLPNTESARGPTRPADK